MKKALAEFYIHYLSLAKKRGNSLKIKKEKCCRYSFTNLDFISFFLVLLQEKLKDSKCIIVLI